MSKKLVTWIVGGVVATVLASACGSAGERAPFDETDGGGTSTTTGNEGTGSSSGTLDPTPPPPVDAGLTECASERKKADRLPLDLLVMLDASSSMTETVQGGATKWDAVKGALKGFLADANSAGIGVGLTVFPVTHAGAPSSCATSADCQSGGTDYGKCFTHVCVPQTQTSPLHACETSADCPGNLPCRAFGQCYFGGYACLANDSTYGCPIGPCLTYASATCSNDECFVSDYQQAKVPIATLPGNQSALDATLDAMTAPTNGATPTSAAVQGGLAYAKQYATDHPGHVVVMVLVTDGLPTRCDPMDTGNIGILCANGLNGTPGIRTFVIGVFSQDEATTATSNLNTIAAAGGTGSAVLVTTNTSVTQQFQQALEAIRGTALPCEYNVPQPEAGTADYDKINVEYTNAGTSTVLPKRAGASACDAAGGWYYDVDPGDGGMPTKVVLCPSSCDAVKQAGSNAEVGVVIGCKTIVK